MSWPIVTFGKRTVHRHVARYSRPPLLAAVYAIAFFLALFVPGITGGGEDDSPTPPSSEITQVNTSRPTGSFHITVSTDSMSDRLNVGHRRRGRASDSRNYIKVRS